VYRFLLRPKWLGGLALAIAAAVVMVFLGIWQWHRYEERSAVNNRIDAAETVAALPLTSVMSAPTRPGAAGHSPGDDRAWTKVTVTGRYDPAHEIQVRGRTVNGDVGFEIVTPLIRNDGSAVLIDRGWLPQGGDALAAPQVPPAPTGQVTVVGQIHLSESRPTPVQHRDGRLDTRRISVPRLAHSLPYPIYGAYVLLTSQTPTASPQFTPIPIDHEDAWQNAGYTVQWWLFAAMALFAFGWQARKEARGENPPPKSATKPGPAGPKPGLDRVAQSDLDRVAQSDLDRVAQSDLDRVAQADRLAAARARAGPDRVAESNARAGAHRARSPSGTPTAISEGPLDRVAESDRRAAERANPPLDRVAESDRRAAERTNPPLDRAAEPDRRAAERTSPPLDRLAEPDPHPTEQADPPTDRVAESDRRAAKRAAKPDRPMDRVAEPDRRAAERAEQADPLIDRVAESDRRPAKRAAKADRPMDRVAESDLKAAQQAARSSRRSD
jgi:cytochrome oxidase assembly protein ShyY1